jgi:hypothetical protein
MLKDCRNLHPKTAKAFFQKIPHISHLPALSEVEGPFCGYFLLLDGINKIILLSCLKNSCHLS